MARYQKLNSELGYVDDVADIEYLKFQNLRHTILGNMLGDFDVEGNYVVDHEIVSELISMKKYIVETIDNIDICASELKLDKPINFFVTFEGDRVTLSLVEKLSYDANFKTDSGIYSDINEFVLDQVETSGAVDKTILYKRWNISETGGTSLDVFNMDEETIASLYKIVNRFKTQLVANQILMEKEEELEEIEAGYTVEIMEILTHYPKLKKAVDTEIKKMLTENSEMIKIDKPYFAKTLNEIITQKIDENINLLNETEKADFKSEVRVAKVNYNNNIRDKLNIKEKSTDLEREDKKPIVSLETSDKELLPLEECAKGFIDAEKKTTDRLKNDAVIAITGHEIVDETGKKEKGKSALATTVLGALATGVAITAGATAVGAIVGAGLEIAGASNRAKLLGAVLGTGLGVGLISHVGEKTKGVIGELTAKLVDGGKQNNANKEPAKEQVKAGTKQTGNNPKKPDKKKEKKAEKKKDKKKEKKAEVGNNASVRGGVVSRTSMGSPLFNKATKRGREFDYNSQHTGIGNAFNSQQTGIGVEPKKFKQISGDNSTNEEIVTNDPKMAERYRKRRLERASLIGQKIKSVAGNPTISTEF